MLMVSSLTTTTKLNDNSNGQTPEQLHRASLRSPRREAIIKDDRESCNVHNINSTK
jgi:hypothetical protein